MYVDPHAGHHLDTPTPIEIVSTGVMTGGTGHYEKTWGDLAGVYRDVAAYAAILESRGPGSLAYEVYEHRYHSGPGALVTGTSIVLPGRVGEEYAFTRGHLHAVADRAELYTCLSGRGIMLMDTVDGESVAIELTPGKAVNVPGHWVHRSVNVGEEPFVTLFCYNADAGQDYELIADANGMTSLILRDGDGWRAVPNPDHTGYTRSMS